jgi:excisionase family DNA binding protein
VEITENRGRTVETYLTIEELANYLRLAEQTIRRWVLNRDIPFHKIKKVIRFRVSEIEKWIDGDGWRLTTEGNENVEGDLLKDAISLDELAELELAEEAADTGDDE